MSANSKIRPFLMRRAASGPFPFEATFRTTSTSTGSSASNQVKLPLVNGGTYDFIVDWGDTNTDHITVWNQSETTHTYGSTGDYVVTITGVCNGFRFNNTGDRLKIRDISYWGTDVSYSANAFQGCANLNVTATDLPTLPTNCANFFNGCTSLTGNSSFGSWVTGHIASFQGFFQSTPFNQNIGGWDVSAGTIFTSMFQSNTAFNQNIGSWNVGSGITFTSMFNTASAFNNGGSSSIGSWNVSNGTAFGVMFAFDSAFNHDLGSWDVSKAANLSSFMAGKTAANFSTANLDAIYNGWSGLTFVNTGLSISFGTAKYTAGGSAGRAILTGAPNNWTITDGGI